jgi:hypothetical protein
MTRSRPQAERESPEFSTSGRRNVRTLACPSPMKAPPSPDEYGILVGALPATSLPGSAPLRPPAGVGLSGFLIFVRVLAQSEQAFDARSSGVAGGQLVQDQLQLASDSVLVSGWRASRVSLPRLALGTRDRDRARPSSRERCRRLDLWTVRKCTDLPSQSLGCRVGGGVSRA